MSLTFLFSDIEDSTGLLGRLGDGYPEVLAKARELTRRAVAEAGGREVECRGDELFCVFERSEPAAAAALAVQRAFAAHPWPGDERVRVRIGLHSGVAETAGDGYVGIDVHRAARIVSAGHGGQVLISAATRGIVENDLPAGVTLLDLGEHRLKDLSRPERVYQLVHPGLAADFPPLVSLESLPNNLPVQLTSFIGREHELTETRQLLAASRLLTLIGPGGAGKTRLAIQLAAEVLPTLSDGAWLIELAPLTDPALVLQTVAGAIGVQEIPGLT
ncbi:MAG TPA: adenylate/guanylate cyclase domain-containing protein, partial [Gaiellaceae bacterium]|nr:adenylate/guanylate cyclase domain-containing protein [Gaiellaceae bacterium]